MSEDESSATQSVDDVRTALPGFIAGSFFAKFFVVLLVVTVAVAGVSTATYFQTSNQLAENAEREYVGVAQQSAIQIQEWRESRSDTTRRLAQFQVIQSGTQEQRQQFLESEQARLPDDVIRVHFVNISSAQITASSDPAKEGEPLNTREAPWQNRELQYGQNDVYISNATEALGASLVSFVTPVQTESGETFVLVMQTDVRVLVDSLPDPATAYSQVVDSQGRVVAGTQGLSALEENDGTLDTYTEDPGGLAMLQDGLGGGDGFVQGEAVNASIAASPDEGVLSDYVIAYAPIEGEEWIVATHVPLSTAYELRQTITQNLIILSGTVLVGFILFGFIFGRGTVQALNRLTRKAQELESGNLDVDLSPTRKDEFGRLTVSFANMRNALRDRIQEAEAARKEAEVSRSEAIAMNDYLQEKAADYSEVMQQCANGDLTQRMDIDGENESMDRIGEDFNDMLDELEKTTGQLKTFSEEVADSSQVVLENARSVQRSSQETAESVDTISTETAEQEERLEELSATLDDVIASLQSLQDETDADVQAELDQFRRVADVLAEAAGTTESVQRQASDVATNIDEQADQLEEVAERADQLNRYASPLGQILDRFQTAAEHEFVFSGGPSQPADND